MAITFPLTPPSAPGFRSIEIIPRTIVGMNSSPYTGQQQVFAWPAQWHEAAVTLPAMKDGSVAGDWVAFFLSCNGKEGTFYLGDSIRKVPLGTIAGTVTVGAGAVANTTTLPLSGGTGSFANGDWLQVGTGASSRLHRVMKVNAGSVDVFPRLRSAYANGTAITYNNAKGLFRLVAIPPWAFNERKIAAGVSFSAMEVLP